MHVAKETENGEWRNNVSGMTIQLSHEGLANRVTAEAEDTRGGGGCGIQINGKKKRNGGEVLGAARSLKFRLVNGGII